MPVSGLDIVVRLNDTSELPLLDRCAFSVLGQSNRLTSSSGDFSEPTRLHVMLSRFSFAEAREARAALRTLRPVDEMASVALHNWLHPEPFDLRVPLLNWSLELAKSRYFTCLDLTDLLFPGACARLLARLRATPAAVALGGATTQKVRWWGDVVLPLPGQPDGDDAPPVFLLDRARVPVREQVFRVGQPGAEIADFVQSLRDRHLADTKCLTDLVGVRQVPG